MRYNERYLRCEVEKDKDFLLKIRMSQPPEDDAAIFHGHCVRPPFSIERPFDELLHNRDATIDKHLLTCANKAFEEMCTEVEWDCQA